MNITSLHAPLAPRTPVTVPQCVASSSQSSRALSRYRERNVGVGYGASSGHALHKRYTSDWGQARFHCR